MNERGTVPGFTYEVVPEGLCTNCCREIPVIASNLAHVIGSGTKGTGGICEMCAGLLAWAWNGVRGSPRSTMPITHVVAVVVLRREDVTYEHEVMMVEIDSDLPLDGQSKPMELPQAVIGANRGAPESAAWALTKNTGFESWPAAMEQLYLGVDMRGRLVEVFLCRAYNPPATYNSGSKTLFWRRRPIEGLVGHDAGIYRGIELAIINRQKLQDATGTATPLSVKVSKAAKLYLDAKLREIGGEVDEDNSLIRNFAAGLSPDERSISEVLVAVEHRRVGRPMLAPPAPELKRKPQRQPREPSAAPGESEELDFGDGVTDTGEPAETE